MIQRQVFLLLVWLLVSGLNQAQTESGPIRVMTYNIWYDNPNNAGNTWDERVDGILTTLSGKRPDILCVQEALLHQLKDLQTAGYNYCGVGRADGKEAGEFTAILFDPERFSLLDAGTFWLSDHPDSVGSIGWDAALPRIATWARFKDRRSAKELYVFNTHFSHIGDTARLESARLLIRKVNEIAGEQPVILTGDFNCKINTLPYQLIVDPGNLKMFKDSRYNAGTQPGPPDFSFVGSDFAGTPGNIIDHIFVSGGIHVLSAKIFSNCINGRCPSDHLPVITDLMLP